ncbi:uncharacterized protein P884DRAFT_215468, partial [Thermothelomyces heterothallicus CBS 202.75]|uniref:uncharacterized protein n=1 Tax=Thermothelomyces heterothallicus CBS 202.75 TaxID=1149848 RepID=UPI0037437013
NDPNDRQTQPVPGCQRGEQQPPRTDQRASAAPNHLTTPHIAARHWTDLDLRRLHNLVRTVGRERRRAAVNLPPSDQRIYRRSRSSPKCSSFLPPAARFRIPYVRRGTACGRIERRSPDVRLIAPCIPSTARRGLVISSLGLFGPIIPASLGRDLIAASLPLHPAPFACEPPEFAVSSRRSIAKGVGPQRTHRRAQQWPLLRTRAATALQPWYESRLSADTPLPRYWVLCSRDSPPFFLSWLQVWQKALSKGGITQHP